MTCPACESPSAGVWAREPFRALKCLDCGFVRLDPVPSGPEMYNESYYEHWRMGDVTWRMKLLTSQRALQHVPVREGKLLDIGCAHGFMLEAARRRGLEPSGVEISPAARQARQLGFPVVARLEDLPAGDFAAVTMIDVIEHIERPEGFLAKVRALLRGGGYLLLVTPDVSSTPARLLKTRWPHYKREHVGYYSPRSLRAILRRTGFEVRHLAVAQKVLTPEYILDHFVRYSPGTIRTRFLRLAVGSLPGPLRRQPVSFPSELLCLARRGD